MASSHWLRGRPAPAPRPHAGERRVVRSFDVASVLRVSLVFYICVLLVFLVASVLLWSVASLFGVIHNLERFISKLFDLKSFRFEAWGILLGSTFGGLVFVALATGANVLAALLYNLISDVAGGVEFTVNSDDPASRVGEPKVGPVGDAGEQVASPAPAPFDGHGLL